MQAKSSKDTQYDLTMRRLKLSAMLFPIHPQFREAPAYYAIYAQTLGLVGKPEALEETAKAMDFNRNSVYLQLHLARLLRESMK